MARPGWCGHALAAFVGGRGGEDAGGCGHALAAFKGSLNTQKMQPGVGSGEGGGVVWAVVVRAGGHALAAFKCSKYSLNT